jgi:hypothetical protein
MDDLNTKAASMGQAIYAAAQAKAQETGPRVSTPTPPVTTTSSTRRSSTRRRTTSDRFAVRSERRGSGRGCHRRHPDARGRFARGLTAERSSAAVVDRRRPELEALVAERTADLQRLQAEYVNYKRASTATATWPARPASRRSSTTCLPVLDSIDAAKQHDELAGGFKLVADELEKVATQVRADRVRRGRRRVRPGACTTR